MTVVLASSVLVDNLVEREDLEECSMMLDFSTIDTLSCRMFIFVLFLDMHHVLF